MSNGEWGGGLLSDKSLYEWVINKGSIDFNSVSLQ